MFHNCLRDENGRERESEIKRNITHWRSHISGARNYLDAQKMEKKDYLVDKETSSLLVSIFVMTFRPQGFQPR